MTELSFVLPPDVVPERMVEVAKAIEATGIDELWLWEDCFGQSGTSTAAAILAATDHLRVSIGLMPVPLRNVAFTAMEIATIARMFPERFTPAIGHGVQWWMAQAGVKVASPLTLLREHTLAIRRLLAGETVTTNGRYVALDEVALRYPPTPAPPILLGAEGPLTLELAGEVGDGVVISGELSLDDTRKGVERSRASRAAAGVDGAFAVVRFASLAPHATVDDVAATLDAHQAAGVTHVAVLAHAPGGPPIADDRMIELAATVATATT